MKAGPFYEKRVAAYLTEETGYECIRRVQGGANDQGDVYGLPGWTVEIKNNKSISLGTTMNEAQKEARNGKTDHFVGIHNRRNHDLARSYATVELRDFVHLLRCERAARTAGFMG